MSAFRICDDLYQVGVLNPNLRVFDIVMSTDYGTTYNSYLLKGKEKTALIEASHLSFFDYFLDNVKEVSKVEEIDYIIMNHNEPDHSGSVAKLLEINPNITVISSQAGCVFLKNITNNPNLKTMAVKDGDTLDLGGRVLTFRSAPFLHWPDSIFTWVEDMGLVFTCDFLGSHYCEPQIMDSKIRYPEQYERAMKEYYDAIFGPFKPYVLDGLKILKELDPAIVCTSHGPVLTKDHYLPKVMEQYERWSTPVAKTHKVIPLFYCSAYGNTAILADEIASGIKEVFPDAEVECYDIIKHDIAELGAKMNESDAFLVGSPTLNRDAVPPVYILLAHADAVNIAKRPVAAFGTYGWSGEAVANLEARLKSLKVNLFDKNYRVIFVPSEEERSKAKAFGVEFANSLK